MERKLLATDFHLPVNQLAQSCDRLRTQALSNCNQVCSKARFTRSEICRAWYLDFFAEMLIDRSSITGCPPRSGKSCGQVHTSMQHSRLYGSCLCRRDGALRTGVSTLPYKWIFGLMRLRTHMLRGLTKSSSVTSNRFVLLRLEDQCHAL
jgi:hypothetical protein